MLVASCGAAATIIDTGDSSKHAAVAAPSGMLARATWAKRRAYDAFSSPVNAGLTPTRPEVFARMISMRPPRRSAVPMETMPNL